jgi:hypothetical protein
MCQSPHFFPPVLVFRWSVINKARSTRGTTIFSTCATSQTRRPVGDARQAPHPPISPLPLHAQHHHRPPLPPHVVCDLSDKASSGRRQASVLTTLTQLQFSHTQHYHPPPPPPHTTSTTRCKPSQDKSSSGRRQASANPPASLLPPTFSSPPPPLTTTTHIRYDLTDKASSGRRQASATSPFLPETLARPAPRVLTACGRDGTELRCVGTGPTTHKFGGDPPRQWSCTAPRNSSIWSYSKNFFDLRCILTRF